MKRIISLALLTLVPLVIACSGEKSVKQGDKQIVAALAYVDGGVWIERGGNRNAAKIGDRLVESDFLVTDSGALVDVAVKGLGVMKVGSEARVQIAHLATKGTSTLAEMKLEKGDLVSIIRKESQESDYNVVTPTAVAGVRGTIFLTSVQADEKGSGDVRFAVMEGSILVRSANGEEVILTPNTELAIQAQKKLTREMVKPLSGKALREIKRLSVFHKNNVSEFRSLMDDARNQTAQIAALEGGDGAQKSLEKREMEAAKGGSDDAVETAQAATTDQYIKKDTAGDPVKLKAKDGYRK
jgi:hypothetical protein